MFCLLGQLYKAVGRQLGWVGSYMLHLCVYMRMSPQLLMLVAAWIYQAPLFMKHNDMYFYLHLVYVNKKS